MITFCEYLILSVVVTTIFCIVLRLLRVKYVWPPLTLFMWPFIIPVICLQLISNNLVKFSEDLAKHLIDIVPPKVKAVNTVTEKNEAKNEPEMSELPQ